MSVTDRVRTALLLGGPRAGEMMAVPSDQGDIVVYEAPHWAAYGSPETVAESRVRHYRRHTLAFARQPMYIWVWDGLDPHSNECMAQLAASIFNPTGLTLLREAAG